MQSLILLLFLLLGCTRDAPPSYGATEVRLVNVDAVPLGSVTVRVTDAAYSVGTIAPGDSVTISTEPTGETGVDVSHAGLTGLLHLDVYFEDGYGGRVRAELTADSVVHLEHANGY